MIVEGGIVTLTAPVGQFNASTASAGTLEALGIPIPPPVSEESAYSEWTNQYGSTDSSSYSTPPSYLAMATDAPSAANTNTLWAGYEDTQHNFTVSYGSWPEPAAQNSNCAHPANYLWAGLGGFDPCPT